MKSQIQTTDLQCEFQRLVEFFGKDWWLEHQSNGVKNYISLQGWIAPPTFISPLHVIESQLIALQNTMPQRDFKQICKRLQNIYDFLSTQSEIFIAHQIIQSGFGNLSYETNHGKSDRKPDWTISLSGHSR